MAQPTVTGCCRHGLSVVVNFSLKVFITDGVLTLLYSGVSAVRLKCPHSSNAASRSPMSTDGGSSRSKAQTPVSLPWSHRERER